MTDRLEPADPCFSDVATAVLAKLPEGKNKITSDSLPEEKVPVRDQGLEVRSMDGRIRAGPEGTPSERCLSSKNRA